MTDWLTYWRTHTDWLIGQRQPVQYDQPWDMHWLTDILIDWCTIRSDLRMFIALLKFLRMAHKNIVIHLSSFQGCLNRCPAQVKKESPPFLGVLETSRLVSGEPVPLCKGESSRSAFVPETKNLSRTQSQRTKIKHASAKKQRPRQTHLAWHFLLHKAVKLLFDNCIRNILGALVRHCCLALFYNLLDNIPIWHSWTTWNLAPPWNSCGFNLPLGILKQFSHETWAKQFIAWKSHFAFLIWRSCKTICAWLSCETLALDHATWPKNYKARKTLLSATLARHFDSTILSIHFRCISWKTLVFFKKKLLLQGRCPCHCSVWQICRRLDCVIDLCRNTDGSHCKHLQNCGDARPLN